MNTLDNPYKESYSIPEANIYIIDFKNEGFVLDKPEEIYINDTTFITKQTMQYWK